MKVDRRGKEEGERLAVTIYCAKEQEYIGQSKSELARAACVSKRDAEDTKMTPRRGGESSRVEKRGRHLERELSKQMMFKRK